MKVIVTYALFECQAVSSLELCLANRSGFDKMNSVHQTFVRWDNIQLNI